MFKRGQVTVFIVIGIVLLSVTGLTYYIVSSSSVDSSTTSSVATPTSIGSPKDFIDLCLRTSAEDGLREILAQGGYYKPSTVSTLSYLEEDRVFAVPYYFEQRTQSMPSLSTIESELELAVREKFTNCVDDFTVYREHGFTLQSSAPLIDAVFSDTVTTVSLTFPILFTVDGQVQEYDRFSVVLPFDFKSKYGDVQEYIALQSMQQDQFLISSLSDLAVKQGADFTFLQSGDAGEDVIVNFGYGQQDEVITYRFGLHYDWVLGSTPGIGEPKTSPLSISRLVPWNISRAGVWHYYPQVQGEGVVYTLDTDIVSIDSDTGEITADTKKLVNDEYLFILQMRDGYNRSSSAPLIINVNVNNGSLPSFNSIGKITTTRMRDFSYQVPFVNPSEEIEIILDGPEPFLVDSKTGLLMADTRDIVGNYSLRVDARNEFGSTWMRFGVEVK